MLMMLVLVLLQTLLIWVKKNNNKNNDADDAGTSIAANSAKNAIATIDTGEKCFSFK